MPKMKTHRGAAKRFARTASGKIKRGKAYHGHCLTHKAPGVKRELDKTGLVSAADHKKVARMIPYS